MGDENRFEGLFDAHHLAVHRYVARRAPEAVIDDVVADTFLVAWRRLDAVPADPLPWLLQVARRVLANELRADRRRRALLERIQACRVETLVPEHEPGLAGELIEGLASLSDKEREAVLLIAWDGLDPQRAARALGCSHVALRVRLHRARRRLEARLADPPHDPTALAARTELPL